MTDARGIVRLGLIGCGRAVLTHHAPALRRVPQIRVTAVADIDAGRLQEVAEYLGVPERYASGDELLGHVLSVLGGDRDEGDVDALLPRNIHT